MHVQVMEIGETDLNALLNEHLGKRISMNFIRYIWEQMLEAVQAIHDESVVHTDLKPANFVLVKGNLKLIDFGISKAIGNDTTNIGRDQQIGTANYMPPEALTDSGLGKDGKRLMKLGRAADVWSLGCILYQMVYGCTPFHRFRDIHRKIFAISNPLHQIDFPTHSCPLGENGEELADLAVKISDELLASMKSCLVHDSKKRATIPELLQQPFLRRDGGGGASSSGPVLKKGDISVDNRIMDAIVQRVTRYCQTHDGLISERDRGELVHKLMSEVRAAQNSL